MDVAKLSVELDKTLRRKIVNLRFKLLQNIGQGQFGKVLLAEDLARGPGQHVAIKTIHRVDTTRLITKTYLSHTTKIKREIQIMKECDHPNVVKLFQVIDDMRFDKILLVLEYCALGEIDWKRYNHYHEKYFKDPARRLPLNRILRDVANGLEYLHLYKNIIHRDLKPSNLLISSDRTIKISDFGVSLILENNANDDKELGKTMGTPAFFAPELCQFVNNRLLMFNEQDLRSSKIDARVDLWSLGVTLYCLFFHQLPFEGFNEFGLFKNIVNGDLKFPRTKRSSLAKPDDVRELALLEDLITRLLRKDPHTRPTLAEIKGHGFTTFDLGRPEIEKFKNVNRHIISAQSPAAAEAFAAESKLSLRLRKLFVGRSEPSLPLKPVSVGMSVPSALTSAVPEQKINVRELEKVDDLLDSYLDDSSSFGSLDEEDTEPQVVETADLFDTLLVASSHARDTMPGSSLAPDLARKIPPPLELSGSNFDPLAPKHSPLLQSASGEKTPSSAHPVVTIGPDSPLSIKSVFSPSRRFFSRFKKKPIEPTISALSGHMAGGFSGASSYTNLAPPPAFGDGWKKPRSNRSLFSSVDSGPVLLRKNSMSSGASNTISKISSSSSSLNLHAYLMDSPATSPKRESFASALDRGKDALQEDGSHTGSEASSEEDADRTMSMDQFLDRLDQ